MDDGTHTPPGRDVSRYEPPELTCLGTVAELTQQKTLGFADGTTFLGLDQGTS